MDVSKKISTRPLRTAVMFLLLSITMFVMLRGFFMRRPETYPVRELDTGWTVSRNGEVLKEDTLTHIRTEDVSYGETFVLERTISDDDDLPSAAIFFRNLHTAVVMRLDGEVIYTSGVEKFAEGKMVGRRLCFAPLPPDFSGKTLTIEMTASENNSFYGIGPFLFGVEQDLFTRVIAERRYPFYIGTFLLIFGMIQLLWLPILLSADSSSAKMLFSALSTVVLGMYLLGYYNLFDLFTDVENVNTIMEYTAFYMMSCIMAGYLATITEGRWKRIYRVLSVMDLCFVILALVLHFLNIIHYTSFILVCYFISFFEALPFIIILITNRRRRRSSYFDKLDAVADRVIAVGFFAYIIGAIIDAGIFSFVKFSGGQEATVRIPFLTAASLFYSFAICMNYFLQGVATLRAEATRQRLHEKAYSDALTGLSNRGECEMVLERLSRDANDFFIISIDLDDLKTVNDTYGHAEGDRMLRAFADILQEVFAGCRLIGRMGGDEFIVILTGEDCNRADQLLGEWMERIDAYNKTDSPFKLGMSYGVARSGDRKLGRRAHDVYMLADARMYDMKRRRK